MHSFYVVILYVYETLVLNSFLMDLYICEEDYRRSPGDSIDLT